MNIAVDATPIHSLHQVRGVGRYTSLLINALQKYDKYNSYKLFTRGQKVPDNVDLVHYPYFDPFFLTMPWWPSKPVIVTVHDLIPIAFMEKFRPGRRGKLKWAIQRLLLQRASAIITDSQASADDLTRYANISLEKMTIVPLAATPRFVKVTSAVKLLRLQKKYNLAKNFLLYVGDVNWNKNIPGLLRAFAKVNSKFPAQLVLVGKVFVDQGVTESREISSLIEDLKLTKKVLRPGFVPDADLPGLFSLAGAYVQPSFAEGFGLSVLDAMQCNCPVIVSDVSSLSEIAGPAVRVNPVSENSLSEAIVKVLGYSFSQRKALIAKQQDWVARFTWEGTARATINVYEKALAGV